MKISTFAPHLAGRMLPGLFSYMPFTKKPRFPGDPWATAPFNPAWYWMRTTECGSPNHIGSSKSWMVPRALRDTPTPPKAVAADNRPGVGPMGARQPADAGPQRELFAEVSA